MSDMTDYIDTLRQLADWLELNELPEGVTVNTNSRLNTVDFFDNPNEVRAALGGEWKIQEHPTVFLWNRYPSAFGASVSLFA